MIIMPSNNTGFVAGRLFERYGNRLAHLHSASRITQPSEGILWALDNGVFGAYSRNESWDEKPFYRWLELYHNREPMWVVVPDAIGDRDKTLQKWDEHAFRISFLYGVKLAMAVQDGMTPQDVPKEADIVFIGGSTEWKWSTLNLWTSHFPRVHVGRVNSTRLLDLAERAGAESCDGTGWFRHPDRTKELVRYLEKKKNELLRV
jgi:hypothetical protein